MSKSRTLVHLIENGLIKPNPDKVEAIVKLWPTKNVNELCEFLGMVNYLIKCIPNLAEITASLKILLKTDISGFGTRSKKMLWIMISSAPVLVS